MSSIFYREQETTKFDQTFCRIELFDTKQNPTDGFGLNIIMYNLDIEYVKKKICFLK